DVHRDSSRAYADQRGLDVGSGLFSSRGPPSMAMQQFPAERVSTPAIDADEQLRYAIEILRLEGRCLLELAGRVDRQFCLALDCLYDCRGSVIVAGTGKAGLIGQKIAATLSSTGTRSHFLHPAEAVHGDLGRIHADDIVLILSQSGETEEITRLLPSLTEIGARTIA